MFFQNWKEEMNNKKTDFKSYCSPVACCVLAFLLVLLYALILGAAYFSITELPA